MSLAPIRAPGVLLWDVDGTLAETERDGHRVAFNLAFEASGLSWRWDVARYGELLRIVGGYERLLHELSMRDDMPEDPTALAALAREIHARKNDYYGQLVGAGAIPLRPGVRELMQQWRGDGRRMGITTTTSRANVEALLGAQLGPRWEDWFAVVVCGEDVAEKKPHPEVFERALAELGVSPGEAVAIEDSPAGVAAARAAQVPVIVTRSAYFASDGIEGAIAVGPGLEARRGWVPAPAPGPGATITLDDIDAWFER